MHRVNALTPVPHVHLELEDRRTLVVGTCIGKGTHASVFRALIEGAGASAEPPR